MENTCSTPVSILILTLQQNLQQEVCARNNRAALIGTLSAFAELPEVEYLWHGIRDMQGWRYDQLVFLIVWQAHVTTADRPTLPVERLLPFLAVKPQGAPSVVFDVAFPGLLKETFQQPRKAINLDCTIDVARIKGRRTEVARLMDRRGGHHGSGNVFYEEKAYQAHTWDLQAKNAECRIRIDVQAERESVWGWMDWWKQAKSPWPILLSPGSADTLGTQSDRICVKLQHPVAFPGMCQMPGQHTIVVPFVRPKPLLTWPDGVGERREDKGKEGKTQQEEEMEGKTQQEEEEMEGKTQEEMEGKTQEEMEGNDSEWDLLEVEKVG